ncbi:MAG: CDGSH iron-sulfur domain-containing protein [Armatimonadota bacterium]
MADVRIDIRENGPYIVSGPVELVDHEGNTIRLEKPVIALCRCGASVKKPFCDGTHSRIGFQGAMRAVEEAESGSE